MPSDKDSYSLCHKEVWEVIRSGLSGTAAGFSAPTTNGTYFQHFNEPDCRQEVRSLMQRGLSGTAAGFDAPPVGRLGGSRRRVTATQVHAPTHIVLQQETRGI